MCIVFCMCSILNKLYQKDHNYYYKLNFHFCVKLIVFQHFYLKELWYDLLSNQIFFEFPVSIFIVTKVQPQNAGPGVFHIL